MYNSTLKPPTCKCGCGKPPTLSFGGYSYNCAPEEIKLKVGNKRKASIKRKNERLSIARKAMVLTENLEMLKKAKELKEWFAYHMANSEKVCENCKFDLSDYNEKDWRSSQDHIIEKSEKNGCPSIAAVLDNHCVLGMWCCHSQKHTSNLNLSKMAIFPTLKERFSKFEHLIAQDERKKIPDIFLP